MRKASYSICPTDILIKYLFYNDFLKGADMSMLQKIAAFNKPPYNIVDMTALIFGASNRGCDKDRFGDQRDPSLYYDEVYSALSGLRFSYHQGDYNEVEIPEGGYLVAPTETLIKECLDIGYLDIANIELLIKLDDVNRNGFNINDLAMVVMCGTSYMRIYPQTYLPYYEQIKKFLVKRSPQRFTCQVVDPE